MSLNTPKIAMIAAMAENRVIGKDNALLWDIPTDMRWFREKTKGKPIIMGRKTYQSIGRALPHRLNIVITRQEDFIGDDIIVTHSLEKALEIAKQHAEQENLDEVFIIGGEQIYTLGLRYADLLYLTHIDRTYEGDAFFPVFDTTKWNIQFEEVHAPEGDNPGFTFRIYAAAGSGSSPA